MTMEYEVIIKLHTCKYDFSSSHPSQTARIQAMHDRYYGVYGRACDWLDLLAV
jgi:hypothetical protein